MASNQTPVYLIQSVFSTTSPVTLMLLLYNVLPINQYIGNITIKRYNKSMSDNRDPTVVLHQEIYTLPVSVASDTRCF